ncbi:PQQ-dependent sugar dehydrogenase [Dongia rigui]|uniref:PQQ-dependent sugar dehydrogenase n=1 Tax=Dongia rigui TaxID=940149 RepID=A0ABU5DXW6_9PROT|nr:PQQ-dependent sugar dehydrogenase [Dongia rigui]MDY0872109.1 PQQ-dependent sugar dehydrogenase [Dongia rigui]
MTAILLEGKSHMHRLLLAAFAIVAFALPAHAQNAPFNVATLSDGLEHPWTIAVMPGSRLLVTERPGRLQIIDAKTGQKRVVGGMPEVRAESEAGALGLALDADFAKTGRLYLCYSTGWTLSPGNRLSAFTLKDYQLRGEQVLLDDLPGAKWHNGCRIAVSPDGHLFASMGDAISADGAQDIQQLRGKIFRLTRDGNVPSDNPFPGSPVWSYGHRNPQGLAFRPKDGALWSTEHGPDTQDEVNRIEKGGNYGWPLCRGVNACGDLAQYHPAVAEFDATDTIAISDLIFYRGTAFPDWQGDILFVSLKTGRLYHLDMDGDGVRRTEILIDGDFGRLRDIAEGSDGTLYLATDNGEDRILHLTPR